MRRRIALGLAALLASSLGLEAQDAPAWRHQSPTKIQHFTVDAAGAVVVGTDSGEVALDGADGHILWSRARAAEFGGLGLVDVGMIRSGSGFDVVDLAAGTTRWSMGATSNRTWSFPAPVEPWATAFAPSRRAASTSDTACWVRSAATLSG